MPGLALFDYVGSFQNGFDKAKQEKQRNGLAGLAADYAQGGQPDFQGIAANGGDPLRFRDDQQKQQQEQVRQISQFAGYLAAIPDPVARNAAYQQIKPRVAPWAMANGLPVPDNVDDSHLPELQALSQLGRDPQGDSNGIKEFNYLTNGLNAEEVANARRIKLGINPRAVTGAVKAGSLTDAQGRERPTRFDPATKQLEVLGDYGWEPADQGGSAQPQPPPLPLAGGVVLDDQTLQQLLNTPANERAAMLAGMQGGGQQFHAGPNGEAVPSAPAPTPRSNPYIGRPAEVQAGLNAGATEQAKIDAQVGNAPRVAGAEAQVAAAKAEAEAAAKVRGERGATSALDLPKVEATSQSGIAAIDRIISHPGLKSGTGLSALLDPRNRIPGTQAYDFGALVDQVRGKAFLEAFASLKGGGAITEVEGQKATDAIAALDRKQSPEQFVANLRLLKGIMVQGLIRARQQARGGAQAPAAGGTIWVRDASGKLVKGG